jgi:putative ABC transport system permease protein
MNNGYIDLQYWQVGIAAAMILISGAISLLLKLGLEYKLFMASIRTVVQLILIGWILQWIFPKDSEPSPPWYYVLGMLLVMTVIAGDAAVRRCSRRYRGVWLDSVIAMCASSWFIGAVAVMAVVQVQQHGHRWYEPQYCIPLMGMILGNTLNGISLGWDRFGDELAHKRDQIETVLALGGTRWEAALNAIQTAVRTGMIPTLNTMMVVGIVSLPGMMTGQILAGMRPDAAVKYQIVIMFLIAVGTTLGTVMAVLLSYLRLFTAWHQFIPGRIVAKGEGGRGKAEK